MSEAGWISEVSASSGGSAAAGAEATARLWREEERIELRKDSPKNEGNATLGMRSENDAKKMRR